VADPATTIHFEVQIDGVELGSFTSCEIGTAEYEVFEYQEGGSNTYVHRLPGRLKYANVKLTRAVDENSGKLAAWFSAYRQSVERKTASITAYDTKGTKIAQWSLVDVYPAKWTGPTFNAEDGKVITEVFELAHNGFQA
jgi:phage tail-like protein